jgi:hypothetical protein
VDLVAIQQRILQQLQESDAAFPVHNPVSLAGLVYSYQMPVEQGMSSLESRNHPETDDEIQAVPSEEGPVVHNQHSEADLDLEPQN